VLRPRWLCWHAFAVVGTAGMLWLGDWQLHRALAGNELSWAYTFEWPLFAVFGVYFWARTIRDELREAAGVADRAAPPAGAGLAVAADEASQESYAARLRAEVRGHGRWHGLR
jgi:hypothetical protein